MRVSPALLVALTSALAACGGPPRSSLPDESEDVGATRRAASMPQGLDGTAWRWVEAHCTEGPLDLTARGYASRVRVRQDTGGLTLVYDQVFATEQCQHTLVQRATLAEGASDFQVTEVARVAIPATRECFGRPEEPRPGEVRVTSAGRLEVLVQRSQWCGGLEVRMVYERAQPSLLSEDEIVRRYAAYFTQGDADAIAGLFAETGTLLEPFTRTDTGDPYRHEGRPAVRQWFGETFQTAPWRAMRITEVESSTGDGGAAQRVVTWEYMDPRLSEPMTGRTRFTIAAGENFEARLELTSQPQETTTPAPNG